jgi:hypothetical protein
MAQRHNRLVELDKGAVGNCTYIYLSVIYLPMKRSKVTFMVVLSLCTNT